MTKEEILNLPNLSIAEVTSFVHIHSVDGYVICNTPTDMRKYLYTNCLYLTIQDEYDEEYRTVTLEENERNRELQKKEFEEKGYDIDEPLEEPDDLDFFNDDEFENNEELNVEEDDI